MNIKAIIHNFIWNKSTPLHPHDFNTTHERTTDELLAELSLYGRPKLLLMNTGWWCFIEATDDTAGAKLTIGSEICHGQPSSAISECLERVEVSGLPKQPVPNTTPTLRLRK